MHKKIIFFLILNFSVFKITFANDSLALKRRNIIYTNPTSILGNMPDVNTIWLLIGYDYRLSKQQIIGASVGAIVYSEAITNGGGLGSLGGWLSNKTSGHSINLEHKFIFIRRIYYSTNLFYQNTKTYRNEDINSGTTEPTIHQYYVKRHMFSITPKLGFIFINKNNIFTDIGIGVGAKYIESKTFEKITPLSTKDKEEFTGKPFEYGNTFKPNLIVQFKIGYNF